MKCRCYAWSAQVFFTLHLVTYELENEITVGWQMIQWWIAACAFHLQGLSLLLALILKALGPPRYYDTDDEDAPDRAPLLNNAAYPPPYVVVDPVYGSRKWCMEIKD